MKRYITQLAAGVLTLAAIGLSSCKKDEVRAVLTTSDSVTLKTSATSVVLTSTQGADNAVTYTWTPVTFQWSGSDAANYSPTVTYTLQLDKKGNNFASPVSVDAGAGPTKTLTVASLNSSLISLGLAPEAAADVEVRLKAAYASNVAPIYSPALGLKATPYSIELYVSSSYLNNNLATAPKLVEVDSKPRQYQGYIYFGGTTASTFTVTNTRAGTGSVYGDAGSATIAASPVGTATNGKLATPGNKFSIAPGFYLVNVNLNDMTWSATPTTWAIIGAATPKGWDGDTPMSYDATKNVLSVTAALTAGEFKFRANNAWSINLGSSSSVNYLVQDGGNLKSPSAGTYTVTLDLSNPSQPVYNIAK